MYIYIYTYAQDRHSIFILPGWRLKPPQAFGAAAEGGRVPRKNPQRRTRELQDGQTAAGAAAFGELPSGYVKLAIENGHL